MPLRKIRLNWLLNGILGLMVVAIAAFVYASKLMESAIEYRSPLSTDPPVPGEPLGQLIGKGNSYPLSSRVVLVIIDALRDDTSRDRAVMPFLNELRDQGASATMHSHPPSFSVPGWMALLSGAWPDLNDSQVLNPPDVNSVRTSTQDNLFMAAHRDGLQTALAGYPWFKFLIQPGAVDEAYYPIGTYGDEAGNESVAEDRDIMDAALAWLESLNYQFILIHVDQVDHAGHHEGGARSKNWDIAATRTDGFLREISAQLDLEKDTLIIVSDHGQILKGGLGAHGGAEPATLLEPFVMVGAGIKPGDYKDIQMADVAPTLAILLGTNIPASNQGIPLLSALVLNPASQQVIFSALSRQQEELLQKYETAVKSPSASSDATTTVVEVQTAIESIRQEKLLPGRIWRGVLSLLAVVGLVWLNIRYRKRRTLLLVLIALASILPLYLRIAFLDRDGYNYFVSTPPWRIELYLFVIITTCVSLLVGWVLIMLGLRALSSGPPLAGRMTLEYIWETVLISSLPVWIHFSFNGALVGSTFPDFWTMFLALLSLLQITVVAFFGMFLVGASTGIAALPARNRMKG
jgi:hypothetical protein